MRLRTLIAPTMAQAMDMLRRELGEDAIIVSSETSEHGVKLVAAVEEIDDELPAVGQVAVDTYGHAHPELQLRVYEVPQIPGTLRRSRPLASRYRP